MQGLDLSHTLGRHRECLRGLLTRFDDMRDGHLGKITNTSHRTSLDPVAQTETQRPYQIGPKAREFVADEVERMLKAKIVELATSEWVSLVGTGHKHDGSYCMCIDYRKLKAVTVRDTYSLLRMNG